jgi:HPt (histidine-containing phosphotransfer) domain-containing protein
MSQSPIDLATLHTLEATTDRAFVQELIEAFLEDGREQIAAMRASLGSGDAVTFQRAAHSLKSSSANLGALELSAQARALELLAKEDNLQAAPGPLEAVAAAFPAVEQSLREFGHGS